MRQVYQRVCKTSDRINEIYKEVEKSITQHIRRYVKGDKSIMLSTHSQINVYYTHFTTNEAKKEFTEMIEFFRNGILS